MAGIDKRGGGPVKGIPEPTLRRLPVYYQYLKKAQSEKHWDYISCTHIGNDLSVQPIQVRKDLELTGAVGRPKLGYNVGELINTIEDFLGWNNTTDAFLVGVGNLGSALLGYQGFRECGLNIVAAFDVDETKIDRDIGGKKVLHVSKLPSMIKRMKVKIGILTVPASHAQELADVMIDAGVAALWNFSPLKINVSPSVVVQHENLAASLVVLSKKLATIHQTNA